MKQKNNDSIDSHIIDYYFLISIIIENERKKMSMAIKLINLPFKIFLFHFFIFSRVWFQWNCSLGYHHHHYDETTSPFKQHNGQSKMMMTIMYFYMTKMKMTILNNLKSSYLDSSFHFIQNSRNGEGTLPEKVHYDHCL